MPKIMSIRCYHAQNGTRFPHKCFTSRFPNTHLIVHHIRHPFSNDTEMTTKWVRRKYPTTEWLSCIDVFIPQLRIGQPVTQIWDRHLGHVPARHFGQLESNSHLVVFVCVKYFLLWLAFFSTKSAWSVRDVDWWASGRQNRLTQTRVDRQIKQARNMVLSVTRFVQGQTEPGNSKILWGLVRLCMCVCVSQSESF